VDVGLATLNVAVPWKVNLKAVFSQRSGFLWVSLSVMGTGTDFVPPGETESEPENVVCASFRLTRGQPGGALTLEMLSDVPRRMTTFRCHAQLLLS
jgi:hypothetical protein